MQFLDEVKIYVKSGDGGKGCSSFHREKFIEFGGPDGGNGGRGADIIIVAANNLNTLIDFRYKQHFKAKSGEQGKGRNQNGESRSPMVLKVPVGTVIYDESGEHQIFDFTEEGQEYVLAQGGRGGLGNAQFKTSTNRAPRYSQPGEPGQEKWVWMKLKLISDVGLLGMPNAGKSTFLSKVSAARPKIADYPFTTLKPQLGVVRVYDEEFVVADIPGLIEGASEGVGLGDKFLKHLERTKILLHLIDITAENVCEAYDIVHNETVQFSEVLADKPEVICLNKADAVPIDEAELKKHQLEEHTGQKIQVISCVAGVGVDEVINLLSEATLKQDKIV